MGTGKVRLRQVKTNRTDVAVTSLCMVVNRIHDPQICPNTKLLDRGLRLNSYFKTSDSKFRHFYQCLKSPAI